MIWMWSLFPLDTSFSRVLLAEKFILMLRCTSDTWWWVWKRLRCRDQRNFSTLV